MADLEEEVGEIQPAVQPLARAGGNPLGRAGWAKMLRHIKQKKEESRQGAGSPCSPSLPVGSPSVCSQPASPPVGAAGGAAAFAGSSAAPGIDSATVVALRREMSEIKSTLGSKLDSILAHQQRQIEAARRHAEAQRANATSGRLAGSRGAEVGGGLRERAEAGSMVRQQRPNGPPLAILERPNGPPRAATAGAGVGCAPRAAAGTSGQAGAGAGEGGQQRPPRPTAPPAGAGAGPRPERPAPRAVARGAYQA